MRSLAAREELEVAIRRMHEPRIAFLVALPAQPVGEVDARPKPGRIEHGEVVGVDRRLKALAQRIASEKDRVGAAVLEPPRPFDDLAQRFAFAPVAVDRVQAGRPAGRPVRLGEHGHREPQRGGQHGARILSLIASQASVYAVFTVV